MTEHRFRNLLWESEAVARLEPDALVLLRQGAETMRIAYQDIVEIKARVRFGDFLRRPARELIVKATRDRRMRIGGTQAKFWAVVPEDRSATFVPFVHELLSRAKNGSSSIRLTLSDNTQWASAAFMLSLALLMAGLIILRLFLDDWKMDWAIAREILVLILVSPMLISCYQVVSFGRERGFSASDLPPDFFTQ